MSITITKLRTDARRKVSRQLTSAEYPDTELDANLNFWYQRILGWVLPIEGSWQIQGKTLVRNFKVGITKYNIPPSLISIYKAEAMYEIGGSYIPVTPISVQKTPGIAEGNSTRTIDDVTKPTIELAGDFVQIRPAPTVADVPNGLKMWAQIAFTDLDDSANTIPMLLEPVARVLSLGPAYDFADSEGMEKKALSIKREIFGDTRMVNDKGLKGEIEELYQVRDTMGRDQFGMVKGQWN